MTSPFRTFAALAALLLSSRAMAQEEIRIGVIYPLTGSAASTGLELKNAAQLAADLINGTDKALGLPLAGAGGLPGLKGAKIKLIFADHQGNPQVGATEAERLITEHKVAAIQGAYFSTLSTTGGHLALHTFPPRLNSDSSSPALTQRGFKW